MKDRTCLTKYMFSCEDSEFCVPGTTCIDKVCMCPDPVYSVFDEKSLKCLGLVGATCGSNGSVASCVPNAKCLDGVCECNENYSTTFTRSCSPLLGHGESCSKATCNFNQGLACINGNCDCVDSHFEFLTGTGCVGKTGSPCGMVKPVADCRGNRIDRDSKVVTCEHYFIQCGANSYCNYIGNGVARCDDLGLRNMTSVDDNTAGTLLSSSA